MSFVQCLKLAARYAGALLGAQLLLTGFVEGKRWQDFRKVRSGAPH
jgi:hypothetical protein